MSIDYYKKKILILGMGVTGISCLNFFIKKKIKPKIIDMNDSPKNIHKIPKHIKYHLGSLNKEWILESNLIVISPGISLLFPILKKAKHLGIHIISDIEIFCQETKKPIVSITGTNGKSTVATLITKMAKKSNLNVALGGNIGIPVLELLNKTCDIYILELSSFQLESTFNLKSKIAIILNITNDHLDRYPIGMNDYRKAKLKIYKNSKICLFNYDDILTKPIKTQHKKIVSFGIKNGDYYLYKTKNAIWIRYKTENICNIIHNKLIGTHNQINLLAAMAISDLIGLSRENSIKTLLNFSGLPHRFQLIHEYNKIKWINDSKSTNIDSTIVALKSIKNINFNNLWLLLGGYKKSGNVSILKKYINNNTYIYCYGKDGMDFMKLLPNKSVYVKTLSKCMKLIKKLIKSQDIILLSPACSSLDQFLNFKQRGQLFLKLAKMYKYTSIPLS